MTQYIEFEWDGHNENKIQQRHNVLPEEAEECFFNRHKIRRYSSRYWFYGQTDAGRYLFIVYIRKGVHKIRIISARDMTDREKQYFRRR
jgi:uncharacterized DUF497 family protein